LNTKLEAAEEELQAERQDEQMRARPPSPYYVDNDRTSNNIVWDESLDHSGYADKPLFDNYDDDDDENSSDDGDRSQLLDVERFQPVFQRGNERAVDHRRSGRRNRNVMSNSTDDTSAMTDDAIPADGGWNKPRRIILVWVLLPVAMLITVFVLISTLNKGGSSNSALANQENGNVISNGSADPITVPCASFSMHLIPDQFGNETSWKIMRYNEKDALGFGQESPSQRHTIVLSGGPYAYKKGFDNEGISSHIEMVHSNTCLPVGSYAFILYDTKGDGICCSYGHGEYGINLSKGRVIRPLSSGNFLGTEEITPFQVATDDIDVLPDLPSSTDNTVSPLSLDTISEDPTIPCASFSMHLIPDQFGNETSWKIMRYDQEVGKASVREALDPQPAFVVLAGGPYSYKKEFDHDAIGSHYEMLHATTCLPVGSYTFTLYDAKGDGICCDYGHGEYGINLSKGRVIRPLSLGKFLGAGQVTPFQVTTDDIDVLPVLSSSTDTLSSSTDAVAIIPSDVSSPSLHNDYEAPNGPCASFSMHLVPDQFGNETSWKVLTEKDSGGLERLVVTNIPTYSPTSSPIQNNKRFLREIPNSRKAQESTDHYFVVMSGGPYSYQGDFETETGSSHYNAIIAETCLPVGSYRFVLYDAAEDGICCEYGRGEYGINLSKGNVIRPLSPGKFSSASEVTPFEVTKDDIDVLNASSSLTDAAANDSSDLSSPSPIDTSLEGSSESPAPDTNVNNVDPSNTPASSLADTGLKDPLASPYLVASRPTTSINSLSSLVTVSDNNMSAGRGKSYGILFDVETTPSASSLVIAGMDLYLETTSPTHIEVWTKAGSWQDVNDANPDYSAGFRQVFHGSITGKGASDFTKIALRDFQDVEIQGGHRQAFWVTLSDNNLVFKSHEGEGISRHEMEKSIVQTSSEEFNVFYGAAVRAYPLELADPETDFWFNAGFLGRLWYKENSNA